MAVNKATSADTRSATPDTAAPAKVAAKKGTKKATTRAGATKVSATNADAAKVGSTTSATTVRATRAGAAKVGSSTSATKPATAARTTKAASKTAARASSARATGRTEGSPAEGPGHPTPASALPQRLRVRENEKPWTARELAMVRAELEADVVRLQREISEAEVDLAGLMRDIGDGAGDDPADAGTATFEREQEISLANNAREVFEQSARALARLLQGSYGICESCGNPIGKNRLLAFPRATLCMTCKSKQERR